VIPLKEMFISFYMVFLYISPTLNPFTVKSINNMPRSISRHIFGLQFSVVYVEFSTSDGYFVKDLV